MTIKESLAVSIDKINMGLKRTRLKGLCHAILDNVMTHQMLIE